MDMALCGNPFIKLGFRSTKAYNLLLSEIVDDPLPSFGQRLSRTAFNGGRGMWLSSSSSMGRTKKGFVCCKKPEDKQTSNPSKLKQEEIVSLLGRIQSSISKERESRGVEAENNRDGSYENKTLSKAILEKPRNKTEGYTDAKEAPKKKVQVARSGFAKKSLTRPSASGPGGKLIVPKSDKALEAKSESVESSDPRGKLTVPKSDRALEEMTEKEEEKPPLKETMTVAELKEVARKRGIKGYSKLKKSELLKLIISF